LVGSDDVMILALWLVTVVIRLGEGGMVVCFLCPFAV